ncbi:MAG: polymer-forming cytoskeletal protein [Candidatus Magasanikbacteria bacterium]|jgi:cytoskeletal protein CcmA (bactofilin family)|nr:polymer-forming cytoskeletal protein [Candidatus Magasanikbacteria bacterium]MBT4220718.1 polymer-forming cytoskeletal protein [Candidatus Magasanikbacteria bacterium]MBT4350063.1 polymer-forming cytoskeletal protein [Candidatus Magasanikbacteria bacterium]MBT4541494.1 polymer-forming cytoskeletal protein [Candidatus Magasanikbacteria bacterium]MBT6253022.1 polymer-forming cytoskeletal protein [Candidatus Magasanikbacteria bacterium]
MFQKPSSDIALSQRSSDGTPDDVETVVGPSVHVQGDFASEGNILVKGSVSGNVKTSRLLTVEEGASIMANVKAGEALVSGQIHGNVTASTTVELTASARIVGDIKCANLVVEAGALIYGKVAMVGLKDLVGEKSEKKRTSRRKKTRTSLPSEAHDDVSSEEDNMGDV